MSLEEVNGGSVPSHTYSFHQVHDLERKFKLDRMHASVPAVPFPLTISGNSNMQAINNSTALGFHNQTMTIPTLPFSIPPTLSSQPLNSISSSKTTKNTLASGRAVAAEDGTTSDKSSICRSPGWDNKEPKKRKKTKYRAKDTRKREEASAMDTKQWRSQNRLSKAPPASRGPSKPTMIHSELPPAVQTVPVYVREKAGLSRGRTSMDAGQWKFMPWRSAGTTADEFQSSNDSEGFIGGVKLQQAAHGTVQGSILKQRTPPVDPHKSKFAEEFTAAKHDGGSFNIQGGGQESILPSIEPSKEAHDRNAFAPSQAGNPDNSQQTSKNYVPAMERTIQRSRKGRTRTSDSILQLAPVSTKHVVPMPDVSDPSLSTSHADVRHPPMSSNSYKDFFSKRPPVSYREPPQLAKQVRQGRPRRNSFGFLLGQRALSEERSATATQNEFRRSLTSTSTTSSQQHSRDRSWSIHNWSKTSSSRPTTAGSATSNVSKTGNIHQAFAGANNLPAPLSQSIGNLEESLLPGQDLMRPAPLHGLRSAVKAAFSRYPYSPESPLIPAHTAEYTRPASIDLLSPSCSSQSPAYSGKRESTMPKALGMSAGSDTLQSAFSQQAWIDPPCVLQSNEHGRTTPNEALLQEDLSNGQTSTSSSLTGSSADYYSTLDEAMNVSTAAEPRPQFERRDTKPKQDECPFGEEIAHPTLLGEKSNLMVDGTIAYEHASIGGHESRTGEAQQHDDPSKSKSSSLTSSKSTNGQKLRQSKFSPSILDFQDLSFLPTLKHQPLGPPVMQKGKETFSANYTDKLLQNFASPLTRPPPTPPSSSSSYSPISSTSLNGLSAQYLQQARQNLPPTSTSSRSLNTASSSESNTIAKMFVICCHCRYFQDMPSKIYKCMAKPDNVVTDLDLGVSGFISTAVKCPWCGHGMSTTCCEGWAAVVVLRERLH